MKTIRFGLFKPAIGSFAIKVAGASLAFICNVLFARLLGPEDFGTYALVMSGTNILATLAALGMPLLVVRDVAVYVETQQWKAIRNLLSFSLRWVLVAGCFIALMMFVGALAVKNTTWYWALLLGSFLVPLLALNQVRAAVLRGLHWVVLADMPELILRPSLALIAIALSFAFIQTYGAEYAIGIQIMAVTMSLAVGTLLLQHRLPKQIFVVSDVEVKQRWLISAVPFLWITLMGMVEQQLPLLLLGGLSSSREAGLYQVAFQLASLMIFGLAAVNVALQPRLAAAWSAGNMVLAQRLAMDAARLGFLIALIVGSILLLFAEELLTLFSPAYQEAASTLRVLVIGQFINAAAGSCGMVLAMTGHQREMLHGLMLALLVNAMLNFMLIPHWGIIGAAVAATSSLITWNVYLTIRSFKLTGIYTALISKKMFR